MSGFTSPLVGFRPLWRLIGADLNSTADQAFTKLEGFTEFATVNGGCFIVLRSGAAPATAAGSIYSATSKSGLAFIPTPSWSSLTTVGGTLRANPNNSSPISPSALYLSLTTPQGAASVADIYILGVPL